MMQLNLVEKEQEKLLTGGDLQLGEAAVVLDFMDSNGKWNDELSGQLAVRHQGALQLIGSSTWINADKDVRVRRLTTADKIALVDM